MQQERAERERESDYQPRKVWTPPCSSPLTHRLVLWIVFVPLPVLNSHFHSFLSECPQGEGGEGNRDPDGSEKSKRTRMDVADYLSLSS